MEFRTLDAGDSAQAITRRPVFSKQRPRRTRVRWRPRKTDIEAGFTLRAEALGTDLAHAIERANQLNQHLSAWRRGLGDQRSIDAHPGFGTLEWLFERYKQTGLSCLAKGLRTLEAGLHTRIQIDLHPDAQIGWMRRSSSSQDD